MQKEGENYTIVSSEQNIFKGKSKGKSKVHPGIGHEGLEGEQRYSSTLSLTLALDGVGGQQHAPAALYPRKDPVPIVQEAGLAPGPVWTVAENLALTGIRYPDRPARSESLYRLSYRGPKKILLGTTNVGWLDECVVAGTDECCLKFVQTNLCRTTYI